MVDTVTLQDACRTVGVSYRTLRKWLARLGIEPKQHDVDGRFWTITDEQLQQLADLKRQKASLRSGSSSPAVILASPADAGAVLPTHRSFDTSAPRKPSVDLLRSARTHPAQTGALPPLPDGLVSQEEILRRCGRPESTVRRYMAKGEASGEYKRAPGGPWSSGQDGRFRITVAFDRETAEAIIARYGQASASSAAREPVPTVRRLVAANT